MTKRFITLVVSTMISIVMWAQDVTVSGKVTDANGSGIPGAIILEKGTTNAVRTGSDGSYSLKIPANRVPTSIVIRSTGLGAEEFVVDGKSATVEYSPSLGSMKQKISEVVVQSASKKSEKVINAPASVSVLTEARLQTNTPLTAVDNLKKLAAVDIMPTGLVSNNVIVRGFNGIFSGAMLYMVDNRLASVPSLKVNAFQLLPSAPTDIKSMELVRGPASALYGPFASQGVLAMYTKSPLDMENRMEVTVGMTAGIRAADEVQAANTAYTEDKSLEKLGIFSPEMRIAGKLSDKVGIKVSGNYMSATDFAFYDSREPAEGSTIQFGTRSGVGGAVVATPGTTTIFNRDFKIRKLAGEARLDWRLTDDVEMIFSAGYAQNTNLELTGLGAAQAKNWQSNYYQIRSKFGKLFLQYFLNKTDVGTTYLIPQSRTTFVFPELNDFSSMQSFQAQHSSDILNKKLSLIYGLDVYLTSPRGLVYGRNNGPQANVNQYGGYAQGRYDFNKQWSFTGAIRADYTNVIDEWMFSPRAAIMYKPTENRTIRLTYNRAFASPNALNFFLDLNNTPLGSNGSIRGFGNPSGFNYLQNGNVMALTAQGQYLPAQALLTNPSMIAGSLLGIRAVLDTQVRRSFPTLPSSQRAAVVSLLLNGINPTELAYRDITNQKEVSVSSISNREAVKSTVNQTIELGYKGFLWDKLSIGVDLYYTRIENFISPLLAASYPLLFRQSYFADPAVQAQIIQNVNFYPQYASLFKQFLTGNPNATNSEIVEGYVKQFTSLNIAANPATIAPLNTGTGKDILLAYFNMGTIDYAGADLQLNYQANNDLNIDFAYSHMNKEKVVVDGIDVNLNAPKHKTSLVVEQKLPIDHKNLSIRGSWRWMDKFDANSALYLGRVNAVNLFDLGLSWRPSKSQGTILSLNVNNIMDHRHQFFPLTSAIGRVALFRVQHTFGVK